jgi:ATP-dependent RNA helicase RhlB
VDLKQVRAIVFDEADRMFDMGFKDDMKFILQRVPRERQLLVFSATLNFDVMNTIYQFGSEPVEINISRDQTRAENVTDEIFHVGSDEKPQHLLSLLKKHNPKQAIIFTNFKMSVERIAKFLVDNGIPAMAISSLLTQAQRNRVIEQFKAENDMNILVATDVAARGLDIKGVDLVINFELPMDSESYVHRIGRTGRAGTTGHAYSLVGDKDIESLSRIEDYLKHKINVGYLENDQLIKDFKPMSYRDEGHYPKSLDRARGPREGGRGGERGGGRGPRREGGGGRGGDRGPRQDRPDRGPRQDRGERAERGEQRAQAAGTPASQPGQRPPHGSGPRKKFEGGKEQGRDGQRRHDNKRPDNRNRNQQHSKGVSRPHRKPAPQVAASKGIGQKISGFFKRLFS